MTVRVGHIGFLNCYPLYYGLEQRGLVASTRSGKRVSGKIADQEGNDAGGYTGMVPDTGVLLDLVPGVPTDLNRLLVDGGIDLGPISSIAYARNYRRLLLSRRLSISSLGAVDSIQVVARVPLTQVRSVALTRQSATSVALLKTILLLRFGLQVTYSDLNGSVSEALDSNDAVLLIGDEGLDALYSPEPDTTTHDLGRLWQEWTGLPMVYAVWATRDEFARQNGGDLLRVEEELVRCMDYGREHRAEVVESALKQSRLDRSALGRYFEILRYDFPPLYQEGLKRFYELAHEAGELDEVPQLRFIDEVGES